jgi:hypothetical protein
VALALSTSHFENCLQTMRACRAQVAVLKDEIRSQKKITYIEAIHRSRELQCKGGHEQLLHTQQIAELEAELCSLEKMHLLELHVHHASLNQLQKVQSGLSAQVAYWGHEMQMQSKEQERALQVCDFSCPHHAPCSPAFLVAILGYPFFGHKFLVRTFEHPDKHARPLLQELLLQHKTLMGTFREVEKEHARESALKKERDRFLKRSSEAEVAKQELVKMHTAAAVVIQAFYRGYKTRQTMRAGRDKGKKGKKKK